MTEATLKSALVKLARKQLKGAIILRHEDRFTSGIPDVSKTGNGRTSWWEVKFANPDFASKGIQELTMARLYRASGGRAYYIVYTNSRTTHILLPEELPHWRTAGISVAGINHAFVIQFMRELHS